MYVLIVGYKNFKINIVGYKNSKFYIFGAILSVLVFLNSAPSLIMGVQNEELQRYIEMYGAQNTGTIAYFLNRFRFWTAPFCVIGIWIGILLKKGNKKIGKIVIMISTILLIMFHLFPLIFAIIIHFS